MSSPHRPDEIAQAADSSAALVLVDLQNDFCHEDGVFARAGLRLSDRAGLVERVNELVAAARAGGRPIVWVRMVWDGDEQVGLLGQRSPFLAHEGLRRGTWGAELLDGLDVSPDDMVLEKTRFSAFFETDLEQRLRALGIETLVVGGVRTDFCVESTVRDALFRDLRVLVATDAVAGYVPELHEHSLRLMGTVFAGLASVDEAAGVLRAVNVEREV